MCDHNPNGKKFEQPIMPADGSRSIDSDMHLVLSLPQFIFMSLVTILGIVRFVVFQGPWVTWLGNSGCNCFQFFVAALDWLHGHLKAEAILAHFLGRILPLAALLSLGSGMMTYQLACSAHYWNLNNTVPTLYLASLNFASYVATWSLYPIKYGLATTKTGFATSWSLCQAKIHLI